MWSWSKLSAAKWEDAWNERISGNPNAVIESFKGGKSIRITVYCETEDDAITLKNYFGGSIREIKTTDWVASQARAKRPDLKIRDNLVITEQVEAKELAKLVRQYPKRAILSIPAEMAFGTGDHATTSTCLRAISDFAKEHKTSPWTITDIGCGTAVLAIAAIALGAEHATAFDFDPIAVDVSRTNAERNHISEQKLEIFQADVFEWVPTPSQQGDIVVANLFSTILQKAFPRIICAMKPGSSLVISGILTSQWDETCETANKNGLVFDKVITKGKWTTAQGRLV
ncbi:50S ribosomal protein L11 methyltransferase [Akkermansia sp. N21169]|jgi:ribosomal protein L11 methyltransferase|uniref:50S ribosomal protein L11 methyltransferase n=1 Tax=unclassified Akkermansia TaxID=2608915 RepID=UPI00244E8B17|nr:MULTISPECIES: 50S ribosomal protein L11 methyltransferase [unclassified Akkermansia]MDH3067883.1 50S ribosomal protein L11 methyltransferase [Akkermansia sp. N21169]WPX41676.1 50S ribosomal protein L11 methyltransferase [Akkermansia sp. N21116]